jgi:hypothetical protein
MAPRPGRCLRQCRLAGPGAKAAAPALEQGRETCASASECEPGSANPSQATQPEPVPTRLEHCLVCAQASGEAVHGQGWTKGVVQHEGLQQAQRLLPDQGGLVVQTACKGGRGTMALGLAAVHPIRHVRERMPYICTSLRVRRTPHLQQCVSLCPNAPRVWLGALRDIAMPAGWFMRDGLCKHPTSSEYSHELSSIIAALWSGSHKVGGSTAAYCMGAPAGLPFW